MSMMQGIIAQMSAEFNRLDAFLEEWVNGTNSKDHNKKAELETPVVVILTKNHGHFVMDHHEIIKSLTARRDMLKRELSNYTPLGENIKDLRPKVAEA